MSDVLAHSPAHILSRRLIQLGVVADPLVSNVWPIYVGKEPDVPDNCVTIFNTTGTSDGRSMVDGQIEEHYGIGIQLRAKTQPIGYVRGVLIRSKLAKEVLQNNITINGANYIIHCAAQISPVNDLGEDAPNTRRNMFTINCLLALTAL